MPQPFPPTNAPDHYRPMLEWGSAILRHRRFAAYQLGLIAAEYAVLEDELTTMFAVLTGHQKLDSHGLAYYENKLAALTLRSLESMTRKIDIIEKALHGMDSRVLAQLDECIKRIKSASKSRNAVLHGVWGIDHSFPDKVILRKRDGTLTSYEESDLIDVLAQVQRAISEIVGLREAFLELVRANLQPRPANAD